MSRRWIRTLAAVVAAFALSACGGDPHELRTVGETEGLYVHAGGLTYQVQGSRQLNPSLASDRPYVNHLPPGTAPEQGEDTWFGVFVRVHNGENEAHRSAVDFYITDSASERQYRPVAIDPEDNPLVYRPTVVQPGGVLPPPDSLASQASTGGHLLLFKLPFRSLANRPLEFHIVSPTSEETAMVALDV